jgi:hypothetical protein
LAMANAVSLVSALVAGEAAQAGDNEKPDLK